MNYQREGRELSDGSEIRETILTLLALERAGTRPFCVAPTELKRPAVSHLDGSVDHHVVTSSAEHRYRRSGNACSGLDGADVRAHQARPGCRFVDGCDSGLSETCHDIAADTVDGADDDRPSHASSVATCG